MRMKVGGWEREKKTETKPVGFLRRNENRPFVIEHVWKFIRKFIFPENLDNSQKSVIFPFLSILVLVTSGCPCGVRVQATTNKR